MREDLYRRSPPEGTPILILVPPSEIPDKPPGGEDIAVLVRGLRTGRVRGSSGMR